MIETGNGNLLSNPGFEHSTIGTDWAITTGSGSSTASTPFGTAAYVITASAQTSRLQSTTGSGSAQAGLNCLVSAYVKTSLTNVRVCAIHNGTLDTNLCVNVNSSNTWGQYQIPTVCDATSTVARIEMSSSGTGSFSVDNVYVGVNPNITALAQSQAVGQSYIAGTTNCYWDRSNTAYGASGTNANCPGPTVQFSNLGQWQTTDADLPRQTINSLPGGWYKICISGAAGTGISLGLAVAVGGSQIGPGVEYDSNAGGAGVAGYFKTCGYTNFAGGNMQIDLWSRSGSGTARIGNSGVGADNEAGQTVFEVTYFGNQSNIVSTINQDFDWQSYTPTFTGFGTPSSVSFYYKRQGSDQLIRGSFVCGTSTATEARVTLGGSQTSSSAIATLEIAGTGGKSFSATTNFSQNSVLIEPSKTYFTFGVGSSTQTLVSKQNGDGICSSGQTVLVEARIPIQGWANNNVIVGTFQDVATTSGSTNGKPKIFSATISSSGVVSKEQGTWINGNCTNATPMVCTLDSNVLTEYNCTCVIAESADGYCRVQSLSASSFSIVSSASGSSNTQTVSKQIICHGY